jgi:hypothetical protein
VRQGGATVDRNIGESAVSFYAMSCVVSFFLGLSTVMLIYGTGIGSHNSAVCRQRYDYPVERFGYSCRLLGFPTSYVENDAWGHNAHVYPWEFVLSVLIWSAVACAALVLLRRYLNNAYEAVSVTNSATRWAIILELLAVPLVFLILVSDLPIRQADLADIFFRFANWWSVLYLPIPILAGVGLLLGLAGLVRGMSVRRPSGPGIDNAQSSRVSRNLVLCLPLFIAAWIGIAIMFVAFIPEVV